LSPTINAVATVIIAFVAVAVVSVSLAVARRERRLAAEMAAAARASN